MRLDDQNEPWCDLLACAQPRDHIVLIATYGRGMWALDAARLHGTK